MSGFDVQVVGAGLVGRCLALSLARLGLQVAWRGAPPAAGPNGAAASAGSAPAAEADVRAFALNAASVSLLRGLKVWEALPPDAATPVLDMTVHGDHGPAALRFSAWQQYASELAWIVEPAALERELDAAVRFSPHVTAVATDVAAPLTAWCVGRDAAAQAALGVRFLPESYGQRAIAARLVADEPHRGVARQWFGSSDVLALLPFDRPEPGRSLALVWSLPEARAKALLEAEPAAFEAALSDATLSAAGGLRLASPRRAWPLSIGRADTWCGPGWVLVGDAAHVIHPLAGQGLNLGLADVAALTAVIAGREPWRGLGDPRLLRRYERQRIGPTWAMMQLTDGLVRAFTHPAPLARELRNRGLGLVDRLTPVKRWLAGRALDA